MPHVLVIGSSNTDLVIRTSKLPTPGETVLGGTFFTAAGGKGANQAVAAARAGAQVTFIACIGRDDFGEQALLAFQREGIDTRWIASDPRLASGIAFILVDDRGENSIVVASGANAALSPDHIRAQAYQTAEICLLQLETPLETVAHAASLATKNKTRVVLNPAPATDLPAEIWPHLFLITPNQTETELLTGIAPNNRQNIAAAADKLLQKGAQNAIITLGSQGAFLATPDQTLHIPAFETRPIDTTGAGDAFNGALSCALSENQPLETATRFACAAGALAVGQAGAQPAMPTRDQIDARANRRSGVPVCRKLATGRQLRRVTSSS